MKTPTTSDFFALGRLFAMLNVKEDIKTIFKNKQSNNDAFEVGYELIMTILEKATAKNVEKEIYKFLAMVSEKTEAEMQNPEMFIDTIAEIKDSAEWRRLFMKASELIITK